MTAVQDAAAGRRVPRLSWNPLYLAVPAVLFVAAFGVYPLLRFLAGGFQVNGEFGLGQFTRLIESGYFLDVLGRTLGISLIVAVIALVLAYPLAYALLRAGGRAKLVLIALVVLPYLTSVLVRTYAWQALLSLNGPVNTVLVALGVLDEPQLLGKSDLGTMLGMIHILTPIAVLTLWSRLEKIDRSQEAVSAALGASRLRWWCTVFLPQSISGAVSAGTLVYILALGAYVIPAALGGTQGLMFAQVVVDQATQLLNWELAGAMGVAMLIAAGLPFVAVVAVSSIRGLFRQRGRTVTWTQSFLARRVYPVLDTVPHRVYTWSWRSLATLVMLFLLLPQIVILVFSFGPINNVTLPPASLSLDGYAAVLGSQAWMEPLGRSLGYALVDGLLATVLGALAAYGFVRGNKRWAAFGTVILLLPVVLPEILMAIGYYVFANETRLSGTDLGVILGQGMSAVGLVAVIIMAVVREVDINLEHAAQMSGASRWRTLRDVVAPLILPGLVVGFLYGFLNAFDNLVLPLFITGVKTTVTVKMFQVMQDQLTSSPAVVASIMIISLIAALAVALILQRSGKARIPVLAEMEKTQ